MTALEASRANRQPETPLAVDLDGTLIHTDVFAEAMLRLALSDPRRLPRLLLWLLQGRAHAKMQLARLYPPDPTSLPYDQRVLNWLREARARGRTIVLATASDRTAAQRIADHVGLFDQVFASDGRTNLKSARKAERLRAAFPGGFCYAGNEAADVKVWRAASTAVTVNAARGLTQRVPCALEAQFPREGDRLAAFGEAIRPQQWAGNVLVFLPLLVDQAWRDLESWKSALIAFVALSMMGSSVVLVKDLSEIETDRANPRTKNRPFASGALSPAIGAIAAMLFAVAALTLAAAVNVLPLFLLCGLATGLSTFPLRRLAGFAVLAGLLALRILLGAAAIGRLVLGWPPALS